MRPALPSTALMMLTMAPAMLHAQRSYEKPLDAARPAGVEVELLLRSSVATDGQAVRQDMRPFGAGWSRDAQLFWAVGQPGAQLRLTVNTAVVGRYQVFLRFTRAPDYGFVRASFDGSPMTSYNGYAPIVSHGRALLGMFDLKPGARQLLIEVARKDAKSAGLNVGLDRIELEPVTVRSPAGDRQGPATIGRVTPGEPAVAPPATAQPAAAQGTVGQAGPPIIAGAQLAFAQFTPDGPHALMGALEQIVYRPNLTVKLTWQANDGGKFGYRWQVAQQPFPPGLGVNTVPPGLLGEGPAILGSTRSFEVPLGQFLPPASSAASSSSGGRVAASRSSIRVSRFGSGASVQAPAGIQLPDHAADFYVRIIPILNGKPFGSPSNTVIAHFQPGAPKDIAGEAFAADAERKKRLAEMTEQAKIYQISFVSFQPMIFPDPNLWGCVHVIANQYAGQPLHPLGKYQPDHDYCGEPYKGEGDTPGFWDYVGGWVKAWDIVSGFYEDAKSFAAERLADLVPCQYLGSKLEGGCKDIAKQVASSAITAGLAATGVPPTIPNLQGLGDVAKGKAVDAAVDYSCKEFESHGGQCTPELRKALAATYDKALDQIQVGASQIKEPGCGNTELAHENGREPLPCFTDKKYSGVDVRPATGSVTELPTVTIRVKRVKPNPPFPLPGCRLKANLNVKNYYPGTEFNHAKYPAGSIEGYPFDTTVVAIPSLDNAPTMDVTLPFPKLRPFALPGHYGNDGTMVWWYDWQYLYLGGSGRMEMSARTTSPVSGATELGGKDVNLPCAEYAEQTLQLPK